MRNRSIFYLLLSTLLLTPSISQARPIEGIEPETSIQQNYVALDEEVVIRDIQVTFIDQAGRTTKGNLKDEIILRELDFKSGDIYNPKLADQSKTKIKNIVGVKTANLELEPTSSNKQANLTVTVEENPQFFLVFGSAIQPPTALQGVLRSVTVSPISNQPDRFTLRGAAGFRNFGGKNQQVLFGTEGGDDTFSFDLDYRYFTRSDSGFGVNFFNNRIIESEFDNGETEVNLPDGTEPFVHRIGGGVELFRPIVGDFQGSLGVSYQLVSIRDGVFADELFNEDEQGNQLTFSDDGIDELLTINLATSLDRRNNTSDPTEGYRFLFQSDQAIPVGDASIFFNRLSANYTHFIPFPLFGFREGDKTLVLNVQGGTIIGDVPGYEAFSLGGSRSVRGFETGDLGTGRSFIQATAEYRFPLFQLNAFRDEWDIDGTLFVDFASDLGSGDTISGEPGEVRDKPGTGVGFGGGVRTFTPLGLVALELGISDRGDFEFSFNFGDRF